jgi:hypothetical protein
MDVGDGERREAGQVGQPGPVARLQHRRRDRACDNRGSAVSQYRVASFANWDVVVAEDMRLPPSSLLGWAEVPSSE